MTVDRYPMCDDQPAQIDCRVEKCKFYNGEGVCTNISPALTFNPDKTFICWSMEDSVNIRELRERAMLGEKVQYFNEY